MKTNSRHTLALLLWLLPAGIYAQGTSDSTASKEALLIERIECIGNQRTSCEYIQQKLRVTTGSAMTDLELRDAVLRLSTLSIFESVNARLEKGSERGHAVLLVEVVEAPAISVEFAAGVSREYLDAPNASNDFDRGAIVGRIGHQNLFGSGKIIGLTLSGSKGADDAFDHTFFRSGLAYIDPQVFDHPRWFGSVSVSHARSDSRGSLLAGLVEAPQTFSRVGVSYESRSNDLGLSVGFRLWEYSYLFFAQQRSEYEWDQRVSSLEPVSYLEPFSDSRTFDHSTLAYGWDSEDDVYFPTKGSRLSIAATYYKQDCALAGVGCDAEQTEWFAAYKQTWSVGERSVWTLSIGGEPLTSGDRLRPVGSSVDQDLQVTYSRAFELDSWDTIRRARWYIGAGYGPFQIRRDGRIGGRFEETGITMGVRMESRTLGIIDLSASASRLSY